MKKIFTLLSIFIIFICTASSLLAQRELIKKYKISGNNNKGVYTSVEVNLRQKCYDFTESEIPEQIEHERTVIYKGFENQYTLINPPSKKYNCAGYGFYKTFGIGPYNFNTDDFDKLITAFGKSIYKSGDLTWMGVKAGDVVMYRQSGPKHVAVVNDVDALATQVTIESKCDNQSLYLHPMGRIWLGETDPLVNAYGNVYIYRFDVSKLKVEEISKPCDCEDDTENFTLRVTVLNSDDIKPIESATVELKTHNAFESKKTWNIVKVDRSGYARFDGVPYSIAKSLPYVIVKKDKFEEKWSDINQEFIENNTSKDVIFTVYLTPDKNQINLECWNGTWYYKDPSGNGYYVHTISANDNTISSWKVHLTSTDRKDDFTYSNFVLDNDYLNTLSVHGDVVGDYNNPNAVSVKKVGKRYGYMDAKFIKGNSSVTDAINIRFYETEKSEIHQNRDWGWVNLYREKK